MVETSALVLKLQQTKVKGHLDGETDERSIQQINGRAAGEAQVALTSPRSLTVL